MGGKRAGSRLIQRQRPAIDAEWQADQRVAEQPRAHLRQRQHPRYRPVLLRHQEVRAVVEGAFDDDAPGGLVKEGCVGVGADIAVPGRCIGTEGEDFHAAGIYAVSRAD